MINKSKLAFIAALGRLRYTDGSVPRPVASPNQ
jgi:hypothetical protein